LVLKTTLERIPLPITKREYPNVEIITGRMSDRELARLCGNADCFLFPSRGEGFGMTPLEAMATGMPAIVPNEHGISEYFNEEYMYEVKIKEKCPAIYARYKGQDVGKMVVADVDDLAKKMRYAYEHQEETIAMGKAASEYVKKWTYANTAKQIYGIVEELLSTPMPERALHNTLEVEAI
jgi:glycosyltransferase involved in cell wall biosynthesis